MIKKLVLWNRQMSNFLIKTFPRVFGEISNYTEYEKALQQLMTERKKGDSILEAGGIDRPLLTRDASFTYVGLDIEERSNCYEVYDEFIVSSIEESLGKEKFDFIISKYLLEHVPDNSKTYVSMYNALKPGGKMLHIFPAKNHPRSVLTSLVGHRLQNYLIKKIRPWAPEGITGYKTFYNMCSKSELDAYLKKTGFSSVNVRCFWGSSDYFTFFVPAFIFISLFNRVCELLNLSFFASVVILSAKK